MKKQNRKILALALMLALVLQYCIGIDSMFVYADDDVTEIAQEANSKTETDEAKKATQAEEPSEEEAPEVDVSDDSSDGKKESEPEDASFTADDSDDAEAEKVTEEAEPADISEEIPDEMTEEDADKVIKQTAEAGGAVISAEYVKSVFGGEVTFMADMLNENQLKKNADAVDDLVGEDSSATVLYAFDLYFVDQSGNRIEPTDDVKISIEFNKAQNEGVLGELRIVHIRHDGTAEYVEGATISDDASSTEFTSDSFSEYDAIAESGDIIPIYTDEDLKAIVNDLNANGGEKYVKLAGDITLASSYRCTLEKGKLTILGEGNQLTATFFLERDAALNLGMRGYSETMTCLPSRTDQGVISAVGATELNIFDGVTIGPAYRIGSAGGVTCNNNSVVNMNGGTITDCSSASVAGGIYLDGHSVFNMYDGTIKNCTGPVGGAVGLSGGSPLGPSTAGPVTFNMDGGTIENCTSTYYGGGAVSCGYNRYPVTFNMTGGTIKNCEAKGSGTYNYGGGAVYVLSLSDFTLHMEGGTITGCSSTESKYGYGGAVMVYTTGANSDIKFTGGTITKNSGNLGGGIFLWKADATIADEFSLHNNTALYAGDDIYNNANAVTLGTVDTSATLESCGHPITGWYEDAESRWSYKTCTGEDDHLELFDKTGVICSDEYGLKAAHGELKYTVTWVNEDGTVLETDENVDYGVTPSYDGTTPTKAATAQYTYTFAGWDPEISEVTKDATYTATYTESIRQYTIRFDSNGGSSVDSDVENYGDPAKKPADPTRSGYTFDGWYLGDQPYDFSTPVTSDITLTARWTEAPAPTPTPTPTPVGPEVTPTDDDTPADTADDATSAGTTRRPRRANAAPAAPAAEPAPTAAPTVPDEPVPQGAPTTNIPDPTTPLAEGAWALINLIAAIATTLGAIVALFRRKEEEYEGGEQHDGHEEEDDRGKRMFAAKAAGVLAGIAAPIAFIITEDITLPMVMIDKWTVLMLVILAVQVVAAVFNKKASELEEEYEDEDEGVTV